MNKSAVTSSPKRVELILDSGVRVYVTPLSRYQSVALNEAAEKAYPDPDKSLYEKPGDPETTIPGTIIPAEENPAYGAALEKVRAARSTFVVGRMFDLCIEYPDFPGGRDQIVEHFRAYIEKQRGFMELPADEWEATFKFAVLRSVGDETEIVRVVRDELPITEAEVSDEMRIFRPAVSRETLTRMVKARVSASGS